MHLPFRSEWRLAMWNGFLSGAQSSSRALAMSSSNLFLNIFSINILNYTNPKLYWNFKVYWTRLAMVTLSKSSWRGCRRPKPQHSQQRPWVKCFWVMVVDRLPKASGLLSLTRMMSPVNSGSKSSVEPGWTFPVEKTSISTRDHWSDTWQRRVWGNAKIRDILQLHPIHLLARDSWSHPALNTSMTSNWR